MMLFRWWAFTIDEWKSKTNVLSQIPTLASCSFDEIVDAKKGDQVQWLQLYVNKNREITKGIVQSAERRGCKGLFITVDAPQLGRREKGLFIVGHPWIIRIYANIL